MLKVLHILELVPLLSGAGMVDAVDPQARASERGNVLLLTLIIVVALAGLALSLNLILKASVNQEFLMQSLGDAPTQARNIAITGINQMVFNLNTGTSTTSSCSAGCSSGTTGFPAVRLQGPNFFSTSNYSVKIVSGTTIVSTGTLNGAIGSPCPDACTPIGNVHVISVDLDLAYQGTTGIYRITPSTWKETV